MAAELEMSPDLAEICGIHAGDGYLRNQGHHRELDISGNVEEKEYYDSHVVPLFERFFGLRIVARFFPGRNTYGFVVRDKAVIEFMHSMGFPYGEKSKTVRIPSFILESTDLRLSYSFFARVVRHGRMSGLFE